MKGNIRSIPDTMQLPLQHTMQLCEMPKLESSSLFTIDWLVCSRVRLGGFCRGGPEGVPLVRLCSEADDSGRPEHVQVAAVRHPAQARSDSRRHRLSPPRHIRLTDRPPHVPCMTDSHRHLRVASGCSFIDLSVSKYHFWLAWHS